jgi:pantoate--beta-alanine ligase
VAHQEWRRGERRAEAIEEKIRAELAGHSRLVVQYIAVAEPETLAPVRVVEGSTIVAVAARVGGTRLIDNITLAEGLR